MLDVAVIIVSWNVRDFLVDCLQSLYQEFQRGKVNGGVWVIDNASTDGSVALIQSLFPQVHIIENDDNVGFARANNQGIEAAKAHDPRTYFLLNPDTKLQKGSLKLLLDALDTLPDAGMVGARLVYGNGRFQHSAFAFPGLVQLMFDLFPMPARLYESRWNGRYPRTLYQPDQPPFAVDHPLGATMLVRADVAESTNGLDETFHMYCEEIDWCWRIHEAGWHIYTVPAAEIVHYGGESSKQIPAQSIINLWRSRIQLYKRHHTPLRFRIAKKLVKIGLIRRADQTDSADIQAAYRQVVQLWQETNPAA